MKTNNWTIKHKTKTQQTNRQNIHNKTHRKYRHGEYTAEEALTAKKDNLTFKWHYQLDHMEKNMLKEKINMTIHVDPANVGAKGNLRLIRQ